MWRTGHVCIILLILPLFSSGVHLLEDSSFSYKTGGTILIIQEASRFKEILF